jgi:hypothetical protein
LNITYSKYLRPEAFQILDFFSIWGYLNIYNKIAQGWNMSKHENYFVHTTKLHGVEFSTCGGVVELQMFEVWENFGFQIFRLEFSIYI